MEGEVWSSKIVSVTTIYCSCLVSEHSDHYNARNVKDGRFELRFDGRIKSEAVAGLTPKRWPVWAEFRTLLKGQIIARKPAKKCRVNFQQLLILGGPHELKNN